MGTTIIITDDNFDHWVGIEYHSMEKRLVSGGLGTSPNNVEPSQLYEATKLTFTVRAVSLEPFRAVTLVGAWSVGAVGVGVTRLLRLAFVDIWKKTCKALPSRKNEMIKHYLTTLCSITSIHSDIKGQLSSPFSPRPMCLLTKSRPFGTLCELKQQNVPAQFVPFPSNPSVQLHL